VAATPRLTQCGVSGGKMGGEVNILNEKFYFLRSPSFKLFGQRNGNSIILIFLSSLFLLEVAIAIG
jgi:hypothetical protein